jgi:hypothetical protein
VRVVLRSFIANKVQAGYRNSLSKALLPWRKYGTKEPVEDKPFVA